MNTMIARPEWFKRRKYGGWGVTPKTWQAWVYMALVMGIIILIQAMPFWDDQQRVIITGFWVAFLMVDIIPVMVTLNRDEREYKNEAIAERNAAWFMSTVLVLGVLVELMLSALNQEILVDWFLVVALIGGLIVKSVSNYLLDKKGV
jgi:predicted Co/Zn/Cd cation transporter (cation efflux family)